MQAVKNITATVKHKAENASAAAEEKKDITKVAAEEKMEKIKAHDEAGKEEAEQRKTEREAEVVKSKEEKMSRNEAEKEKAVNHHCGSPGIFAPADLDLDPENPTQARKTSVTDNAGVAAAASLNPFGAGLAT